MQVVTDTKRVMLVTETLIDALGKISPPPSGAEVALAMFALSARVGALTFDNMKKEN